MHPQPPDEESSPVNQKSSPATEAKQSENDTVQENVHVRKDT